MIGNLKVKIKEVKQKNLNKALAFIKVPVLKKLYKNNCPYGCIEMKNIYSMMWKK